MLGIGLMLFCLRGLTDVNQWNQKLLKISFWSLNVGLAMMTFLSLLPQGLWQSYASIKYYYAYARSAEFVHSAVMEGLVWARVPGDIVFSIGVFAFALFVFQAFTNKKSIKTLTESE
jgi:nitric oxide reductase subunit B